MNSRIRLRLIAEGRGRCGLAGDRHASASTASRKAFADLANPEAHTKIIVEPWR